MGEEKGLMGIWQLWWTQQAIKVSQIWIDYNPKKGRADKRKIKYTDRMKDLATGDIKCMSAYPQMNLVQVYKNITKIKHLSKNFKTSLPRVKTLTRYPYHTIPALESVT